MSAKKAQVADEETGVEQLERKVLARENLAAAAARSAVAAERAADAAEAQSAMVARMVAMCEGLGRSVGRMEATMANMLGRYELVVSSLILGAGSLLIRM